MAENLKELIVIVNDKNEIIGQDTREKMRQQYLFHRSTYIYLINSKGQICTHLRHQDKKWCGGYWTTCFGGVVGVDEDYNSNALKELHEEAGISNQQLTECDCFVYSCDTNNVWGKVYYLFYDGEVEFQKEEIDDIKWMFIRDIKQSTEKFTPDANEALKVLIQTGSLEQNKQQFENFNQNL